MPDCELCDTTGGEVNQTAYKLKENLIRIVRVNCYEEKSIYSKYDMTEFPNFLYFVDRKSFKYTGPNNASGIAKWIRSKQSSSFDKIEKTESLREKTKEKRVSFVYFGELNEDEQEALQQNSLHFDNIAFFYTENQEDFNDFNVELP